MQTEENNAVPSPVTSGKKPESSREFIARLKDPQRWKTAVFDVILWFMFGIIVTTMLSRYTPGYPIIVGTPSIPTGVYWLDKTQHHFSRGDYVTFSFEPKQEWLKGRYGQELVHTKQVLGVSGDVIKADAEFNLTLCQMNDGEPPKCVPAGKAWSADSKGRPLYSWVPANHEYTLKPGELWIWAPHLRSLDSRYHGPVLAAEMHGKAKPLFLF